MKHSVSDWRQTEKSGLGVTLDLYTGGAHVLGRENLRSSLRFSWFYAIPPGKFQDETIAASFHILYHSLLTNHPTIQLTMSWITVIVVVWIKKCIIFRNEWQQQIATGPKTQLRMYNCADTDKRGLQQQHQAWHHDTCLDFVKLHSSVSISPLHELHKIVPWAGTAVAQWLRWCATNRKVAGSIPDGVIGPIHWHKIPPIALWPWGRPSL